MVIVKGAETHMPFEPLVSIVRINILLEGPPDAAL
jgi:hypothetical protein